MVDHVCPELLLQPQKALESNFSEFPFLCMCFAQQQCTHAQSFQACPTFCDPMDCSPPASAVHGLLQARILEWAVMPLLQGIFPTQGSSPRLLHLLQWQAGSLPLAPPGRYMHIICKYILRLHVQLFPPRMCSQDQRIVGYIMKTSCYIVSSPIWFWEGLTIVLLYSTVQKKHANFPDYIPENLSSEIKAFILLNSQFLIPRNVLGTQ